MTENAAPLFLSTDSSIEVLMKSEACQNAETRIRVIVT